MALAVGSVLLAIGLFVGIVVVSYSLLHESGTANQPSRLEPVQVVGPEETLFSWNTDRCEDDDIPDLPARAFRDAAGQVQLITTHFVNRRFIGPSLDRVAHRCEVTMRSGFEADPARFNDREWLAAPYTLDGRTIYALVHNEYQGHSHPGRCPSGEYFKCWYNSVTHATSRDGGNTFRDSRPPPAHLVASIPSAYVPDAGYHGIFSPSNIVRHRGDGYYYSLVVSRPFGQQLGSCLIRTKDLADPASWRAWDGSDFRVSMPSPYEPGLGRRSDHVCTPVSRNEIINMHESLTYNTYLEKYVLVGLSGDRIPGRRGLTHGIYYSVSDNLRDWSRRKLIREAQLPWTYKCGESSPVLYPSLLDPESTSRNFETTGKRPYMYFTRTHYRDCVQTLNRDLIRVQLEFDK